MSPVQAYLTSRSADVGQHRFNTRFRTGDRAVQPLGRNQQRAFDRAGFAHAMQPRLHRLDVLDRGESIQGGDANLAGVQGF
jgi:hypothetical protein